MIELRDDALHVSFPELHPQARCIIEFQRTLRIPDDNRDYPLPPGLGRFPLRHVDDLGAKTPKAWLRHGGVALPMYESEAMWIRFECPTRYPFAIKVAAGKVNAVTGDPWSNELHAAPQGYVVAPEQPWLDGFHVAEGRIRQFVAMPLGEGYSVEEQLTGMAEHGGVQLIVYPMKPERYEALVSMRGMEEACIVVAEFSEAMSLAPGGLMRQKIYEDPYGLDAWRRDVFSRCFVHLASAEVWEALTGERPPHRPPTAKEYTEAGLPWYEYEDGKAKALKPTGKLSNLDSVAAKKIKKGEGVLPENDPVTPKTVVRLGRTGVVREGEF